MFVIYFFFSVPFPEFLYSCTDTMDISIKMFCLAEKSCYNTSLETNVANNNQKANCIWRWQEFIKLKKKITRSENYKNTCQNFAYKKEETLQSTNCFLFQNCKIGTLTVIQGKGSKVLRQWKFHVSFASPSLSLAPLGYISFKLSFFFKLSKRKKKVHQRNLQGIIYSNRNMM